MKNRIKSNVNIVSLLFVLYGILGPLEIYAGNYSEFEFGMNDFFLFFVLVSLTGIIIVSVVLSLIQENISRWIKAVLYAIGIGSYIQNLFLNRKLSNVDGTPVEWNELISLRVWNSIFWLVLLLGVILLFKIRNEKIEKILSHSVTFLLLIQVVTVFSLVMTTPKKGLANDQYQMTSVDQFSVASGQNVLLLVLDSYNNDDFDKLLDAHPETKNIFRDFVYYADANSEYKYTFPSVCHMLTTADISMDIDSVEEKDNWKRNAWINDECDYIYSTLHQKGFACNLYIANFPSSLIGVPAYYAGKIDNMHPSEIKAIDYGLCFRLLAKMSLYKYAPYIFKPRFEVQWYSFRGVVIGEDGENDGKIIESNAEYYSRLMEQGLQINDEYENLFVFTLLDGMHRPYTNDEKCQMVATNLIAESEKMKAQLGLNLLMEEYISQLKDLNVYDDAMIIITADHGGAEPFLLVKYPHVIKEKMEINYAPVNHSDIWPSIMRAIGVEDKKLGIALEDVDENEVRERTLLNMGEGFVTFFTNREDLKRKNW